MHNIYGENSFTCIVPSMTVQLRLVPLAPPHLRSPILIVAAARDESTLGSLDTLQPIIDNHWNPTNLP